LMRHEDLAELLKNNGKHACAWCVCVRVRAWQGARGPVQCTM